MAVFHRAGVGAAVGFDHDLLALELGDYVLFARPIEGVLHLDHRHPAHVRGSTEHRGFISQFNIHRARGLLPRLAVDVHGDFAIDDDADFPRLTNAHGFVDANVQLTQVQGTVHDDDVHHAVLHRRHTVRPVAFPHPHAAREGVDVEQNDSLGFGRNRLSHAIGVNSNASVQTCARVLEDIFCPERSIQQFVRHRAKKQLRSQVASSMEAQRRLRVYADAEIVLENNLLLLRQARRRR